MLYMLLSCYTITIVKPLLPFISDFIGHVFFYTQHMATVHYENGNYHVHYETAKVAKEENDSKSPVPSSKKDNSTNEHVLTAINHFAFSIEIKAAEYALKATPSITAGTSKDNYPPPRVLIDFLLPDYVFVYNLLS